MHAVTWLADQAREVSIISFHSLCYKSCLNQNNLKVVIGLCYFIVYKLYIVDYHSFSHLSYHINFNNSTVRQVCVKNISLFHMHTCKAF